jgi:hypothetical protein
MLSGTAPRAGQICHTIKNATPPRIITYKTARMTPLLLIARKFLYFRLLASYLLTITLGNYRTKSVLVPTQHRLS